MKPGAGADLRPTCALAEETDHDGSSANKAETDGLISKVHRQLPSLAGALLSFNPDCVI